MHAKDTVGFYGLFVHKLARFTVVHRPYDKPATALHSTTKQLVLAHVLSANHSPRRSDSSYTSGSKGKHDETPTWKIDFRRVVTAFSVGTSAEEVAIGFTKAGRGQC